MVLQGAINSEPFRITRRRGARRNDLYFTLGDRDLTTQSVKDTQQEIDSRLGIGNGLLQRCCFFGQHSHTLHSLLGLTDVKLKSELSYLVDTTLWQSALADVRAREKVDKARALEIGVELRVRGEELGRLRAGAEETDRALRAAEEELVSARGSAEGAALRAREVLVSRFGTESSAQLAERLTALQREALMLQRDRIDPLRNQTMDVVRAHAAALRAADEAAALSRESGASARASLSGQAAAKSAAACRLLQQQEQYASQESVFRTLIRGINNMLSGEYSEPGPEVSGQQEPPPAMDVAAALHSVDLPQLRAAHEAAVARWAAVGAKLASVQAALTRLREAALHSHAAGEDCPTCGQVSSTSPSLPPSG